MKTILFFLFISIPYIVLSNSFGTINEVANENGTLLLTAPKGTVIDGIFLQVTGAQMALRVTTPLVHVMQQIV
ncbi:MAG: hypothetical protein ACI9DK_000051 [Vicingaceae bacterium]|jgi:hypothetical protein